MGCPLCAPLGQRRDGPCIGLSLTMELNYQRLRDCVRKRDLRGLGMPGRSARTHGDSARRVVRGDVRVRCSVSFFLQSHLDAMVAAASSAPRQARMNRVHPGEARSEPQKL